MNPLLERPSTLLAKIESVKGTPETLTTADGEFNVMDVVLTEGSAYVKRERGASAGNNRGVAGAMPGTLTFRVHLENSGSATPPPWATTFLPSCGYILTGSTFTRTLDTSLQKTLSAAHFKGAGATSIKQAIAGAMGKFRIVGRNGAPSDVLFEYTGKFTSEENATLIDPTKPTTLPPRGYEAFTINSVTNLAPEFTLDAGQLVKLLEGPNDATDSGYVHAVVSDYVSKLTCEPYVEPLSVINWRELFRTSTELPLSAVFGSGATNVVTMAASKLQLTGGPGFGTRERIYTRSLDFDINDVDGFTIALS